jgi:hypothetical protein
MNPAAQLRVDLQNAASRARDAAILDQKAAIANELDRAKNAALIAVLEQLSRMAKTAAKGHGTGRI